MSLTWAPRRASHRFVRGVSHRSVIFLSDRGWRAQ